MANNFVKFKDPNWENLSEEGDRKTNSDIHEMFYVSELLKDEEKFEQILRKMEKLPSFSSNSSNQSECSLSDSEELHKSRLNVFHRSKAVKSSKLKSENSSTSELETTSNFKLDVKQAMTLPKLQQNHKSLDDRKLHK